MPPKLPQFLFPGSLCWVMYIASSGAVALDGQLSMRFGDGSNEVTLLPSDTMQIDLVWTMGTTDKAAVRLSELNARFNVNDSLGQPAGPDLTVASVSGLPGWSQAATQGIGQPFSEGGFYLSTLDPANVGFAGNGTVFDTIVASFVLRNTSAVGGEDVFVTFRHNFLSDALPLAYDRTILGFAVAGGRV